METIGWLGSVLLALCGFPQAVKSWQDGHSRGLSWMFLLMWTFGEILVFVYILPTGKIPLILNYGINIIFVGVIIKYKLRPRNGGECELAEQTVS